MAVFEIETNHFILFKMNNGGHESHFNMSKNPKVMKFITGHALSRAEADEMYETFLLDNLNEGYLGRYFIKNKVTGELLGTAKLELFEEAVEIGYRLMEHHWGKGFGTEVAEALVNCCRHFLPKLPVIAFVNDQNSGSIRVLEKVGMVLTDTLVFENEIRLRYTYKFRSKLLLKKVLYVIFGLMLILLFAAMVMPKDYALEREIVVNSASPQVFEYLRFLENQEKWSVWASVDATIKKHYTGTPGEVGSTYFWESENRDIGVGAQEIKMIMVGKRIDFELRFTQPLESTSAVYLISEPLDSISTKVKWGFAGIMPVPMNLMLPFLDMENRIGNDFSQSLQNLKVILEK